MRTQPWRRPSASGGGVGSIAAGNAPADYVRQNRLQEAKTAAPDKPFGVNIMLLSPFAGGGVRRWWPARGRQGRDNGRRGSCRRIYAMWKDAGITVIPVVPSRGVGEADGAVSAPTRWSQEGMECGGHIGELTTMALVPQVAARR